MPPPPPPAPPPIPKQPLGGAGNKASSHQPPPDRNALLSQIKKGTALKKAVTNDRSQPLIEGNRSSSNSVNKRSTETKSNGPFPVIPPGGLFAQGIPKLRPTTPRSGESSLVIQSLKSGHSAPSLDHLRIGQLSGSRSQPPSPVSKPRVTSNVAICETKSLEISSSSCGNPNFPSDINIKGPAPTPPPASQKPVFRSNTKIESSLQPDSSIKHTTVKRSASQTNLGQRPRIARPPPNVKPPPPPKSSPIASPQSVPPPPPSKPPNILRRQSFGTGESHTSRFASNKLSVANNNCAPKPVAKGIGPPPPPPPPRNNSAPNDLNQMLTNSSGNQWNKMNIAPPPPPNRAVLTNNRSAPMRPPPPRAPAPPPPPMQHQFPAHPAPPSQMKAMPSNMAPTPPTRISSIKNSSDFEERFKNMFCQAQSLPKPDKFMNMQKNYPSTSNQNRTKQNIRRQPPPPPPQNRTNLADAGRSQQPQPKIHIQLESEIFSNNVARC